jgi:hypothetical protein
MISNRHDFLGTVVFGAGGLAAGIPSRWRASGSRQHDVGLAFGDFTTRRSALCATGNMGNTSDR